MEENDLNIIWIKVNKIVPDEVDEKRTIMKRKINLIGHSQSFRHHERENK